MRLLARHGVLLLAVMGAGAEFVRSVPAVKTSSASSSQSMTSSGASSGGPEADADLRDSHPEEPNDSFMSSGTPASQTWSSAPSDRGSAGAPSDIDRGSPCFLAVGGARGACMETSECEALGGHVSTPGHCRGSANIECCTSEPHIESHAPTGWSPVPQARVTTEMTVWAAMIVESPEAYPMGSKTTQLFGAIAVMARVEWHPAHPGHGVVHRGVTLYQPG
ncbi:MAG: hypothetical protein ACLP1X_23340 [Polyangiaceae bacterium]